MRKLNQKVSHPMIFAAICLLLAGAFMQLLPVALTHWYLYIYGITLLLGHCAKQRCADYLRKNPTLDLSDPLIALAYQWYRQGTRKYYDAEAESQPAKHHLEMQALTDMQHSQDLLAALNYDPKLFFRLFAQHLQNSP